MRETETLPELSLDPSEQIGTQSNAHRRQLFRAVLYHLSVRSSEGSQRWHEKSGNCRQYDMDLVIAKIDMRIPFSANRITQLKAIKFW